MSNTEQKGGGPEQKTPYGAPETPPEGEKPYEPQGQQPPDYGGKPDKPKDPCGDPNGGGSTETPEKSKCKCTGECKCTCETELPKKDASIRRIIEELRKELTVPPKCDGVSKDAKADFEKALDECDKEYEGVDGVVKDYHDYYCAIDCKLDEAKGWCKDIDTWCKQLKKETRKCIDKTWIDEYEKEEHRLFCCCWIRERDAYEKLEDCLEQAKSKETRAKGDFEKVKNFQATLKGRFEELKKLYDDAKKYVDAKEPKKVCAVFHEFQKVYHELGVLKLWAYYDEWCGKKPEPASPSCDDPKYKPQDEKWLRGKLIEALKELIRTKFHRYCLHQHRLDVECKRDRCKKDLDAFRETRRKKFILEAHDCPDPKPAEEGTPAEAPPAAAN